MTAVEGPDRIGAIAEALTAATGAVDLERHETHASVVLVTEDRALKVKKPVVLPFLDYGTLQRRRAMCREELRVNRRLAADLYLETVGLVQRPDGSLTLDDDEAPGTVEVGVLMRRFDERDTLAAHVAAGTASLEQIADVGARLAAFHAAHPLPDAAESALASLRAAARATLDHLEAAAGDAIEEARVRALRGRLESIFAARRGELLERGRRGLVVDGHGDLRAEHVLLTTPPQIVDALEFDPGLRIADTSADLGFLVMDLEAAGAAPLARALVASYRAHGGDAGDDALLAAMGCYRALVRAKVQRVRADQGDEMGAVRAQAHVALALRLGWRSLGPIAIAFCGPPASGKSTLAAAAAAESGLRQVSSDVVRKARAGIGPTDRALPSAYTDAETVATYRAIGEQARDELAAGRGVLIDATLGRAIARDALRSGLGPHAERLLHVECRVPMAVALARAERRAGDPARVSDADGAVVERLTAAWQPLDEVEAERHLAIRADRPVGELICELWAWLDRLAPTGVGAALARP